MRSQSDFDRVAHRHDGVHGRSRRTATTTHRPNDDADVPSQLSTDENGQITVEQLQSRHGRHQQ